MKRVPLSIRIAATLAVASLAACGGGGDAPASSPGPTATSTGSTPDATSTSTAAAAPAPGAAPAPAASAPSPSAAPAPAAPTLVGDPVAGKALFSAIPGSAQACIDCHAVADVRARAKTEAGYKAMIEYAIYQNVADMAVLKFKLTDAQLQDIAAYLKSGNP
jgi:mono/diheme cytochrome c family protein